MAVSKGSLSQMLNAFEDKLEDLQEDDLGVESSFDYPDDLEDLENGEYESHVTDPVEAASFDVEPKFDVLEKSTIEATDDDDEDYVGELSYKLYDEIFGLSDKIDNVEVDNTEDAILLTVTFEDESGEFSINDYEITLDELSMDDMSADIDVITSIVDADLD